ncbi:RNA binding domain-containing protein [Hamiltosporidium tvaerminnensis]|uniref:RNA binding domain-containing protein n=1 Tax=Hamiltosporidium tvaerminnensis TaxID=1176355 RepID=A0A4Q9LQ56_9MICR|nr:RNA binding domain-containing protein [Hamiltosporidium tvaerminnensis]
MRIIIKNLPNKITELQIRSSFSKFGEITSFLLPLNEKEKPKRFCFIGYSKPNNVINIMNNSYINNSKISVEEIDNEKYKKYKNGEPDGINIGSDMTNSRVYVTNLPNTSLDIKDEIYKLFKLYGGITNIVNDSFAAIVTFDTHVSALKSLELNNCEFLGVLIKVRMYNNNIEKRFNTFFFDFKSIINQYKSKDKEVLLNLKDSDLGTNISLLESHLIAKTKDFLVANNIDSSCFTERFDKKVLIVKNYDVMGSISDSFDCRVSVSPFGSMALLYFKDEENARKAYKSLNCRRFGDKAVYCDYLPICIQKKKILEENLEVKQKNSVNKLIVKNVPFQADKNEIKRLFSSIVSVVDVRMPVKGDKTSRGFAFVTLKNANDVTKAIEYLGTNTHLYGRRLVIDKANK